MTLTPELSRPDYTPRHRQIAFADIRVPIILGLIGLVAMIIGVLALGHKVDSDASIQITPSISCPAGDSVIGSGSNVHCSTPDL